MFHGLVLAGVSNYLARAKPAVWMWLTLDCVAFAGVWLLFHRIIFTPVPTTDGVFALGLSSILSPTAWFSLALTAVLVGVGAYGIAARPARSTSLVGTLGTLSIVAVPAWLAFYWFVGGNLSEFRMLMPVLLPIFLAASEVPAFQPALRNAAPSA